MRTKLSVFCDKFIEAGWIAALILTPLYMNIYTHRMFEPDKASLLRSIALLMLLAYAVKILEKNIGKGIPDKGADKKSGNKSRGVIEPAGQLTSPQVKEDWRLSLFLPALIFAGSYTLSCITSETPYASLWGSYDRLQGLYTFSAYIIIFLLTATHMKTRAQIERLFTAVILTAIPIALYGIMQKLKLDPVPWQHMDPSARISSTMGNPIFLAAYIILIVPLVMSRLTRTIYQKRWILMSCYLVLFFLLSTTVLLSGSRGPMLALLAGIFSYVLLFSWSQSIKWLFKTIVILAISGAVFLGIFNIPHIGSWDDVLILKSGVKHEGRYIKKDSGKVYFNAKYSEQSGIYNEPDVSEVKIPANKTVRSIRNIWDKTFGKLQKVPYIGRLGFIAEHKEGSGRVRMILWKGIMQLITESPFRFFVGHGPESLSTVYYRYFTMELTKYEGIAVHADRAHNAVLDVWVWQGVIGLFAYLFLVSSIVYLVIKAAWPKAGQNQTDNILFIGLLAAVLAYVVETFFGIPIVCTNTHFWAYIAVLYALRQIRFKEQSGKQQIMPAKQTNNQFAEFDWTYYLFWTYIGFSLLMQVILIKYYWPDEHTNTDTFIIGTYIWLGAGLIISALGIKFPGESPRVTMRMGNAILYLILLGGIIGVICISNLNAIRADGYYKFCYSYDGGAEQALTNPPANKTQDEILRYVYELRLISVPYYLKSLRLAPTEKNYLNGAGRNFLELSKLKRELKRLQPNSPDDKHKITAAGMPALYDLIKREPDEDPPQKSKFSKYSSRDFFICSAVCINDAYLIEPENYERILGMIRIYRFWGQTERDEQKLMHALDLCREAHRVAPLHDVPFREMRDILRLMEPPKSN